MDVKMNKEIRNYKEYIYFGLTLRNIIFLILCILTVGALFFKLRDRINRQVLYVICIIAAVPFAIFGDFMPPYHGMPMRKFLLIWLRYLFVEPKQLKFKGTCFYQKLYTNLTTKERNPSNGRTETIHKISGKEGTVCDPKNRSGRNPDTGNLERRRFPKRKNLQ